MLAAVGAVLAGVTVFVYLASTAPEGDHLGWENQVLHQFRDPATGRPAGPEWLPSAISDLSAMGGAVVLVLLGMLTFGYLMLTRRRAAALLLLVAVAGGQALNLGLKHLFVRDRPDAALHLVEVRSPSFPSGHSMAASIFYLTTGALLTQTARRRREKLYLVAAAIFLTGLIGFSRVYLGVHYPTDVIAGWSAGAVWAVLCWAVAARLRKRGQLEPAT
jgi:undecaprenyl-diphosphatase